MGEDVFGIVGTTQAAHFKVEAAVAEGGFAVVYRAHHDAFRAPVALKCLKVPGALTQENRATFLEKFRAEAELLFRLSAVSPAVVRPLQVGTLDLPGRFVPFLALEWLEGETFEAIRDRRDAAGEPPLALRKVVRMLSPVAEALAQAHRLPGPNGPVVVIHCDLKPDNLFRATVGRNETIKILDFGIARVKSASGAAAGKTTGGGPINAFTPQYGSPEQWQPEIYGQTGPWTDVWGLAISIVDLISAKPPVQGSLAAMMLVVLDEKKRPTPRASGVTVSDAVENTFKRALGVDPKQRTGTIEAFWTELEEALGLPPTFKRSDARAEKIESIPPPDFFALPDLQPAEPPKPAPKAPAPPPSAPRAAAVRVVDPVDLATDEQQMSLQLVRPPPSQPRRMPAAPAHVPLRAIHRPEPVSVSGVMDKLSTSFKLLALAVAVMVAAQGYVRVTGEQLPLGPVQPIWIAGPLVALAVIVAFVKLMGD